MGCIKRLIFFLPLLLTNANRTHVGEIAKGKTLPSAKEFLLILFTFGLTVFAWIFFRAENLNHAITYIGKILSMSLFEIPRFNDMRNALILILIVAIFLIIEWNGRGERYSISNLGLKWKKPTRYFFSIIVL